LVSVGYSTIAVDGADTDTLVVDMGTGTVCDDTETRTGLFILVGVASGELIAGGVVWFAPTLSDKCYPWMALTIYSLLKSWHAI